jgi:pimeloyl-ACP methyl ester carboxylesterase
VIDAQAATPGRLPTATTPPLHRVRPSTPAAHARRRLLQASAALAATTLAGCGALPSRDPLPLDILYDDRGCSRTLAPVLLVLLPGIHMAPDELRREGFIAALRQRGVAADVMIPALRIDHVQRGEASPRLRAEVIGPARAAGYRRIVLAGISLGGYAALHHDRQHPGDVEAVVTIAPYLGRPMLLQQIAAAGGAAAWRRGLAPASAADDVDTQLWRWLAERPANGAPLWLGAGSDDRFAAAHRLLAALLPAERAVFTPGGHDWAPWRTLWSRWLDGRPLPLACPT